MDTHEIFTSAQPSVKAGKKHIVMFVTACVLLVGTLFFLLMPALLWDPVELPDDPSDYNEAPLPGVAIVGVMVMGWGMALVGLIAITGFALCWVGGQVISALLAMNKKNKPRRLWIASLVLTLVYPAVMLVMQGLWFLA